MAASTAASRLRRASDPFRTPKPTQALPLEPGVLELGAAEAKPERVVSATHLTAAEGLDPMPGRLQEPRVRATLFDGATRNGGAAPWGSVPPRCHDREFDAEGESVWASEAVPATPRPLGRLR